jgi:ABC-type transport system substrate-binding protein
MDVPQRGRGARAVVCLVALTAVVFVSCPPAPPGPTPAIGQSATPMASVGPSVRYADRIRIGLISPGLHDGAISLDVTPRRLSNASSSDDEQDVLIERFLYNGLFRYDGILRPVPDLARDPCIVSADGLTATCSIREATFSNGTPMTADDVVFTFELAKSKACSFGGVNQDTRITCLADVLGSVTSVDAHTVRFHLLKPYPPFFTVHLPLIWIDSKALVEQQFEAFETGARTVGAARLRAAGDEIEASLSKPAPDCGRAETIGGPLVTQLGLQLPDKGRFNIAPGGTFDACRFALEIIDDLHAAADSLDATGIDAVAIAYPRLDFNAHPVGTGAWMIDEGASIPGKRIVLKANPHSFSGPPATPVVVFEMFASRRDAASALEAGQIDWLDVPSRATTELQGGADVYRLVRGFPGITFAEFPDPTGNERLYFNLRPGRPFADKNIRKALELCIDKPKIVEAATDGQGTPAYGFLSTKAWFANDSLAQPKRDIEEGRRLIESSNWHVPASAGTYERDGRPLSATIWVNATRPDRIKLVQLIALQAADCGMDIRLATYDPNDDGWPKRFYAWPQDFDALMIGAFGWGDPDGGTYILNSANILSASRPGGENMVGYNNPMFDELAKEGRATTDLSKRAQTYRQMESLIADDLPILVLSTRLERVAIRDGLTTTDGPLNLHAVGWNRQLEKMVLPIHE